MADVCCCEQAERTALIRAAKDAKLLRTGIRHLTAAELDAVFADPSVPPEVALVSLWEAREAETVAPCVACGNPGGSPFKNGSKPGRYDGSRFGVEGVICVTCYGRLKYRQNHPGAKPRHKGKLPANLWADRREAS